MKLYFSDLDDEGCYTINTVKEQMVENGVKELVVKEAKRVTGESYFWCTNFQDVGEVGQCGRFECTKYTPRNGKNGRCKYSGYCYEPTEKTKIIKLKAEIEIVT